MKKILATAILAIALVLIGSQQNQAEASDYYVGTWRSGYDAYLMTETIKSGVGYFECAVKAVKNSHVMYIDYHFSFDGGNWHFSNSDGVSNMVSRYSTKIENNIVEYFENKPR